MTCFNVQSVVVCNPEKNYDTPETFNCDTNPSGVKWEELSCKNYENVVNDKSTVFGDVKTNICTPNVI